MLHSLSLIAKNYFNKWILVFICFWNQKNKCPKILFSNFPRILSLSPLDDLKLHLSPVILLRQGKIRPVVTMLSLINYPQFPHLWASLVAQLVKNPPTMWETCLWSLDWEDPLEKGKFIPIPVFWPGEFHGLYNPWGRKESDTTERLSLTPHLYNENNNNTS